MRELYLNCKMGAAGDMLTAALLELIPDKDGFINEINSAGVPNAVISSGAATKCGVSGTRITVKISGEEEKEILEHGHTHRGLHEIEDIVKNLKVSENVKRDVIAVYKLIAEAESRVHGVQVSEIHFSEVGAMDAVCDILAVCMLMERIRADRVTVSPICVGSGSVKCAHGILPVPAPATAYILRDVPIYGGEIKSELCTPTGAALLKYFADDFGELPMMKTQSVGYGMGKKDFEAANCIQALLGESDECGEYIAELSCNIDDMTAEMIGFAMSTLLDAGALDVYTVPIGMKKSRPGTMLCVICSMPDREKMTKLIFSHTTTLGVRENISHRYTLSRREENVKTPFGDVRKKMSQGYGVMREKLEYDDVARIAAEQDMSIYEVCEKISEYESEK